MSVIVEDLGNGNFRENFTPGAPVEESFNARFEQLGPFLQSNPAASQAATAMLLCGNADANALLACKAGTIIGVAARSNATITAGTATFQPTVGGTAKGSTAVLDTTNTTKKITLFSTPIPFSAGDLLAVTLATNGAYAPTTADHQAWLLIRWAPNDA